MQVQMFQSFRRAVDFATQAAGDKPYDTVPEMLDDVYTTGIIRSHVDSVDLTTLTPEACDTLRAWACMGEADGFDDPARGYYFMADLGEPGASTIGVVIAYTAAKPARYFAIQL